MGGELAEVAERLAREKSMPAAAGSDDLVVRRLETKEPRDFSHQCSWLRPSCPELQTNGGLRPWRPSVPWDLQLSSGGGLGLSSLPINFRMSVEIHDGQSKSPSCFRSRPGETAVGCARWPCPSANGKGGVASSGEEANKA